MLEVALEPALRADDRRRRGQERDPLAEGTEAVGDDQPAEQGTGAARLAEQGDAGGDQHGDRCPGGDAGHPAAAERGKHQQRERSDGHDQLRQDGEQLLVHQWPSAACAAGTALPGVKCESPVGAAWSMRSISRPTSARIGLRKLSG